MKARFLMFALILALFALDVPSIRADTVERRVRLMGTELSVRIDAQSRQEALEASARAVAALADAEARLSTWSSESELSRFNAAPAGTPTTVSPRLARDLDNARRCALDTGGAFSPGLGALVGAWGLREGGRRPEDNAIAALLPATDVVNLRIRDRTAMRLDDRFLIEEGAFGKGAGLDDATEALATTEANGAVLNLGGQIAVWGSASAQVEIADPEDRERPVLSLTVETGSVATTGNSERGIVVDGMRLGHVLDPLSGQPAPDFGSVTVMAPLAVRADCLATALYAMGPDRAMEWAAARPDVAVIVLERDQDRLRARATANLRGRLTPVAETLNVIYSQSPERGR